MHQVMDRFVRQPRAIASTRRDRDIVSSARLILVISKRVSDLSADPPTLAREPRVS